MVSMSSLEIALVLLVAMLVANLLALLLWRRCVSAQGTAFVAPRSFELAGTRWCDPNSGQRSHCHRRQFLLFAWRLLVFVWMLFVQLSQYRRAPAGKILLFFTVWNYHWQILFWGVAAVASASYLFRLRLHEREEESSNICFRKAAQALFEVSLPMAFMVSIVLWSVLMPAAVASGNGKSVFNFYSYNQHALNTIFISVEFCTNRLFVELHHLLLVVAWGSIFSVFTWVQHQYTGMWPYFFMRLNMAAFFWYPAVMAVHVGVYMAAVGASRIKRRLMNLPSVAHQRRSDIALINVHSAQT